MLYAVLLSAFPYLLFAYLRRLVVSVERVASFQEESLNPLTWDAINGIRKVFQTTERSSDVWFARNEGI